MASSSLTAGQLSLLLEASRNGVSATDEAVATDLSTLGRLGLVSQDRDQIYKLTKVGHRYLIIEGKCATVAPAATELSSLNAAAEPAARPR